MTCMLKCLGAKCTDDDNVFEMHQKIKWTGRKIGSYVIKNSKEQNSKMLMGRKQVMSIWVFTENSKSKMLGGKEKEKQAGYCLDKT